MRRTLLEKGKIIRDCCSSFFRGVRKQIVVYRWKKRCQSTCKSDQAIISFRCSCDAATLRQDKKSGVGILAEINPKPSTLNRNPKP